jgi:DNA-binding CsgD family transcriptional regulator
MQDPWRSMLASAMASLKGTNRQKHLALAYAESGSEKQAARATGLKASTAKTYMLRLYAKNGVTCMLHLLAVAFHNLLDDRRRKGVSASHPEPRPTSSAALTQDFRREPRDERTVAEG